MSQTTDMSALVERLVALLPHIAACERVRTHRPSSGCICPPTRREAAERQAVEVSRWLVADETKVAVQASGPWLPRGVHTALAAEALTHTAHQKRECAG